MEFMPSLLPNLDVDIREAIQDQLARTGIKLVLNAILSVVSVPGAPGNGKQETPADRNRAKSVRVRIEPRTTKNNTTKSEEPFEILCDAVLSATGRGGNTAGMNLDKVGCKLDRTFVEVAINSCIVPGVAP